MCTLSSMEVQIVFYPKFNFRIFPVPLFSLLKVEVCKFLSPGARVAHRKYDPGLVSYPSFMDVNSWGLASIGQSTIWAIWEKIFFLFLVAVLSICSVTPPVKQPALLMHHESLEGRNTQPLSFAWSRSEHTPVQPLSAALDAARAGLRLSQMSLFLPGSLTGILCCVCLVTLATLGSPCFHFSTF